MSSERPVPAQPDLFDGEVVGRGPARRLELAVEATLKHATETGVLGELDVALAGLALELARACDQGTRRFDPYAVAAAGRELREVLARLKLDPSARPVDVDGFEELVKALGAT